MLAVVPFELFRPRLKAALEAGGLRTADGARKSAAGRKPWDEVLIFKHVLSQSKGCWCCRRFTTCRTTRPSISCATGCRSCASLALGWRTLFPDAKTLWLYREALTKAGAVEGRFNQFDAYLKDRGYLAMGGLVVLERSQIAAG